MGPRTGRASLHETSLRLLSQARAPVARALRRLHPQAPRIRKDWRRALETHVADPDVRAALLALPLPFSQGGAGVPATDLDHLVAILERHGEELARRGVAAEHLYAAVALHLESMLPYAIAQPRDAAQTARALARLSFVERLALTSGFSSARTASWGAFDDRERRRLSRDLHDEVGHQLVVLKLYLELIARDLPGKPNAAVRQKIEEAQSLVANGLQSIRRLILDLGPAVLEEVGLCTALRLYARQFSARTGVQVEIREAGIPADLSATYQTALYRLMQGALSNVLKHASASNVRIILGSMRDSAVVMIVEDDGVGFEASRPRQAFGLEAMRERVEALGGRFHLESHPTMVGRKRHGTRIEIDLPVGKGDHDG
jgi:signal transduction histidine kinase